MFYPLMFKGVIEYSALQITIEHFEELIYTSNRISLLYYKIKVYYHCEYLIN